jgi:4-amino-4-deoxy-L-arabinose transferase-like glycosyltransferase
MRLAGITRHRLMHRNPGENKARSVCVNVAVVLFFLFVLALMIGRVMPREPSRDEEQFISAGALLLRDRLLPYIDYPYFHVPNLAFVYAGLFAISDRLLLAARAFNVLCGWLTVILVFALAAREFRKAGGAYVWLALGAAAAVVASPVFRLTSGSAWNHDLAVLSATAAFAALLRAADTTESRAWLAAAGALLGLAIGTRMSFLPLLVPFACVAALDGAATRERLLRLTVFSAAVLVALTPLLILCARAPEQFFFGNFIYNGPLNRAYRIASGDPDVGVSSKLAFAAALLKFPHNVALLAAFVYLAIWLPTRRGWRTLIRHRNLAATLLCFPFLLIGALAPSPSYKQYYYALVPFLVLACVLGVARAMQMGNARRPLLAWYLLSGASVLALFADVPLLRHLAFPAEWPPVRVHALGKELRAYTSGRVLTLSPLLPLEAGLDIYKEFATGSFAWRTAALLPSEQKSEFRMVDSDALNEFLAAAPPAAILMPVASADRSPPFADYVEQHQYRRVPLRADLDLWLKAP